MSHVPPPFTPSAPRRKDNTLTIVIVVIIGLVLFCACGIGAAGYFGWGFIKNVGGPMAGCMMNFEATRNAIMDYAKDHNGKLPNAETWQDDVKQYISKYLKEGEAKEVQDVLDAKLMDPDSDKWGCFISESRTTGIAYNSDLSGKLLTDVAEPWSTTLIFEIEEPRKNAAEKYQPRPRSTSPTIMGEPRGWLRVPMQGEIQGMEGNQSGVRFNSQSRSGSDEETK